MLFIPNPLAGTIARLLAGPAVEAAAAEGLALAQARVPVDTGALRDSLHIEDAPDGGKRVVTDSDHWVFPEFGTSTMAAQPYLRPIIDDLGLHR